MKSNMIERGVSISVEVFIKERERIFRSLPKSLLLVLDRHVQEREGSWIIFNTKLLPTEGSDRKC